MADVLAVRKTDHPPGEGQLPRYGGNHDGARNPDGARRRGCRDAEQDRTKNNQRQHRQGMNDSSGR